jgi:hypothetical protein
MKSYTIRLFKAPKKNDPIVKGNETELVLTERELLDLKRTLRKDKKIKYSITMLNGGKEPLLISERLQIFFKKIISYLWIH